MADPKKDKATSSDATAPGNGDAWNTVPDKDGSASAESSSNEDKKADANDESKSDASKDGVEPDEILDAVLEAEAAAIVDNAMDEVRAEAAEKAAEANAASAGAEADKLAKEVAEWKDKYVRLHAEWDTYRRRQKEQAETQKALAAEKLVSSLIPVVDDLERTIDYAEKNGETGLLSGVEAVLAKFIDTLKKDGVEVIDPAGEPFEALEEQAVGTVEDASVPEETVADVYQKGYKIGNKVLRPAMVTITTGGPRREKSEEDG